MPTVRRPHTGADSELQCHAALGARSRRPCASSWRSSGCSAPHLGTGRRWRSGRFPRHGACRSTSRLLGKSSEKEMCLVSWVQATLFRDAAALPPARHRPTALTLIFGAVCKQAATLALPLALRKLPCDQSRAPALERLAWIQRQRAISSACVCCMRVCAPRAVRLPLLCSPHQTPLHLPTYLSPASL